MKTAVVSLIAFLLPSLPFQKDFLLTPIPESELVKHQVLGVVDKEEKILVQETLGLMNRDENQEINRIFVDNILLNLHYLHGDVEDLIEQGDGDIRAVWEKVRKPFEFSFVLSPGMVFSFHDNLMEEFEKGLVVTTGNQFSAEEGYKQAYGIFGNGVCHLASLMNWTADEVGLEVVARQNHDFSPIAGVPQRFGTLISYKKDDEESKEKNLYIKNNFDFPVVFQFKVRQEELELVISKL